jgi:hypothetical protein
METILIILFSVLLVLKLVGAITLSWWLVWSPIIFIPLFYTFILVIAPLLMLFVGWVGVKFFDKL